MGFSGFENILKKVNTDENLNHSSNTKFDSANRTENEIEKHISDISNVDYFNDDVREIANHLNSSTQIKEQNDANNQPFAYGNQQNKNVKEKKIGDGHRKRARERFLLNPDGVSDYDLLELLLFLLIPRADTKPIARTLLDKFKTINGVFTADNNEIIECGVNAEAIKYLSTLMRVFFKKILQENFNKKKSLNNFTDIKQYCLASVGGIREEEFHIIFFNSNFTILKDEKIGLSGLADVSFAFRNVIKLAIDVGAKNAVLYHNHPSGDISPSKNDIETTKKITDILNNISVVVQDHIIVAGDKCFSFVENGIFNKD